MTTRSGDPSVLVVGAGISGVACARALAAAGVGVRVVERGRVPGGRMASRRLHERPVDLGASYFTVPVSSGPDSSGPAPSGPDGSAFAEVVADWHARGLARHWTRTFAVADAADLFAGKDGPERWAAPGGLRSLVADLATGLEVQQQTTVERIKLDGADGGGAVVDGVRYDAVVLAMPDPQAARLLPPGAIRDALRPQDWDPAIAVVLGWTELHGTRRHWPADLHGVFVNDSATLGFVADDGDRRGDGAPVLVAHSTATLAAEHLDDPDGAIAPVAAAVAELLGIHDAPEWSFAHRWSFARPVPPHPEPYLLDVERGAVGVCGDGWGGASSVSAAWTSGDALGRALAHRVG